MPDPSEDTRLLVAYVREAGAIARKFFGGSFKKWDKGGGNPVTEADIAIDRFLREKFLTQRPDYGWLSEESVDDPSRLDRERTFVVDPIDGTHGFLKGRPQFTIVAAVVAEGRPQSAAIYNPMTEELFEASLGRGARENGRPIQVTGKNSLDATRLLATRDFLRPAHWATPWPETVTVENRASIAYRMALVADGSFDAMVSLSAKSDWDLAAGDLIVHEAGGKATDDTGRLLTYNRAVPEQASVVCAHAALHGILLERLKEHA